VVLPAVVGSTTISFMLGVPARATVNVLDPLGRVVTTLLDEPRPAGPQSLIWAVDGFADGRYTVQVTATPVGRPVVSATVGVVVDRTISSFSVSPPTFSPNGDGRSDTVSLTFGVAASAEARVEIFQGPAVLATPLRRQLLASGVAAVTWDGTSGGARLADGSYDAALTVSTPNGEVSVRAPVTIDTAPPQLRIVDGPRWRFWVSEPATVTLVVNGQTTTIVVDRRGEFSLPHTVQATSISGSAIDAAGNISAPLTWP
jgi:hypothetical protein